MINYIKLGLISLVAFTLLIWGFTLLFPSVTVISRVRNITGTSEHLMNRINTNEISMKQWLVPDSKDYDVRTSDISFYVNDLFNAAPQPNADTLYFEVLHDGAPPLYGGLATYQLYPDSVTTQLYYVFQTPWYKPLHKLKMMMIDKQIGPQMDSALLRLYNL